VLLASACVAPSPQDAGVERDTALAEGMVVRTDATVVDDAAQDVGGDAAVSACGLGCDPSGPPGPLSGCPIGQRCVLEAEAPTCRSAAGLAAGSPCDAVDACGLGLACFRASRSTGGVCAPVCCPRGPDACVAGRCGGDGVLVDGTVTAFGRCLPPRRCDVLAPELTCEAREGCYVVDALGTTECRLAGVRGLNDSCVLPEDCAPGLFCGGLGARTCLRICAIDTPRCEAGQRCVAQSYSPAGSGVCVEPAG